MNRLRTSVTMLVLLAVVSMMAMALWAQAAKPITLKGLTDALKIGGLTNAELVKLIEDRGVDFELTRENEAALKAAGASAEVLLAVHDNYRGAPPVNPESAAPTPAAATPTPPPVQPVVLMPTFWTSTGSPADFRFQFSGDHIYAERINLPPQFVAAGGFMRIELAKSGEKWVGTFHGAATCTVGFGQYARVKMCPVQGDAVITSLTPSRIEGTQTNWDKYDCAKCKPKDTTQTPFVLVPKQ